MRQKIVLLPLDRRPSLFDVWSTHKFTTGTLAIKAKVPPGTVQAMLCNQPISHDHAQNILVALSNLLHKECTFDNMYVELEGMP